MQYTCLVLCALCVFEARTNPIVSYQSQDATPWPHPALVKNGTGVIEWTAKNTIISTSSKSEILRAAISRFRNLSSDIDSLVVSPIHSLEASVKAGSLTVVVSVSSDSDELLYGTDESYALHIDISGLAVVNAPTPFGAMHALTTLAQLMERTTVTGESLLRMRGLPWNISDKPRFAHRGMLVDASRHFLPMQALRRQVDVMSMNKLNVLHLHLTDFQSFPLRLASVPEFAKGAFSDVELYTPDDLRDLRGYALDHGVRVMAEVSDSSPLGLCCAIANSISKLRLTLDAIESGKGLNFLSTDPTFPNLRRYNQTTIPSYVSSTGKRV